MKKYLILSALYIFAITHSIAQTALQYTIAPWRDNKKAAVSITLDDALPGQFTYAVPLLKKYHLAATFFITPRIAKEQNISWQTINEAAANGNEIANHTLTHPHLQRISMDSLVHEVDGCNKLIDEKISKQKCITLAYPFGDGGNINDSENMVMKAVQPYCIGARATRNNTLTYNTYNFAKVNDDYYRVNSDMITDSASIAAWPSQLDETIAAGGWYVPTYHGIENGWIITPTAVFEKHLQELVKRQGSLWIAPFANVIKYHKERNCATVKLVKENTHSLIILLTDTLQNTQLWNEPLTINLRPGHTIKSITQSGNNVPFTAKGQEITFNALPGYEIILTK